MSSTDQGKAPAGDTCVIYRKSIRTKSGKVLIAAHYGLKAFPIRVQRGSLSQLELF